MNNLIFEKNHNGRFIVLTKPTFNFMIDFLITIGLPLITIVSLISGVILYQKYPLSNNNVVTSTDTAILVIGMIFNYSIYLMLNIYDHFKDKEGYNCLMFLTAMFPYIYIILAPLILLYKIFSFIFLDD